MTEEVVDNNAYDVVIAIDVEVYRRTYIVITPISMSVITIVIPTWIVVMFPPGNTLTAVFEAEVGKVDASCFA